MLSPKRELQVLRIKLQEPLRYSTSTGNSSIPDSNREDPVDSETLNDIMQLVSSYEDNGTIVETVSDSLFLPSPALILECSQEVNHCLALQEQPRGQYSSWKVARTFNLFDPHTVWHHLRISATPHLSIKSLLQTVLLLFVSYTTLSSSVSHGTV